MHANILNVFARPVIFHSGKSERDKSQLYFNIASLDHIYISYSAWCKKLSEYRDQPCQTFFIEIHPDRIKTCHTNIQSQVKLKT